MFKLKWLAVLVLVLSLAQPCIAGDLSPIVGTWRLVSFEREYQAGGEREYPMGKAPTGYILFLPEGRMTVVITTTGVGDGYENVKFSCIQKGLRGKYPERGNKIGMMGTPLYLCVAPLKRECC